MFADIVGGERSKVGNPLSRVLALTKLLHNQIDKLVHFHVDNSQVRSG